MVNWGGSGIERYTFDFIMSRIDRGANVIELGAGHVSTPMLSKYFNLYSIEHDANFVGLYPGVNYIHAPEKDGWYDVSKFNFPKDHAFVLVDGLERSGILKHLDLFNKDAMFMVHDTYRAYERKLAFDLSKALGRNLRLYDKFDHFGVI